MSRGVWIGLITGLLVAGGAGLWWWSQRPPPLRTHIVVSGDTLWAIAKAQGVTVDELRSHNGLSGDLIEVGQRLEIPGSVAAEAQPETEPVAQSRSRRGTSRSRPVRAGRVSTQAPEVEPPTGPAPLTRPAPQPCLAGPEVDAAGDEPEFAASAGLSAAQLETSLSAFIPQLYRCMPTDGSAPEGVLDLEIGVGCDGRVSEIDLVDSGGLSATLSSCVVDALHHAPFPPHDQPGGFTFRYPLRFSP